MPSGGRREGSGRKAVAPEIKRVQLAVTVDPPTKEILQRAAKQRGINVGRLLDIVAGEMKEGGR